MNQLISIRQIKKAHLPSNSRLRRIDTIRTPGLMNCKPAIFLDRDGVLIDDVGYLSRIDQIKLLDRVPESILLLQQHFYIIIVTNQSGIARSFFNEQDLLNVHTALINKLNAHGAIIDYIYFCPHFEGSTDPQYSITCNCRKPLPGMLLKAREEWGISMNKSFLIGDMMRDVTAGESAGVKSFLINNSSNNRSTHSVMQSYNLWDVSQQIISIHRKSNYTDSKIADTDNSNA